MQLEDAVKWLDARPLEGEALAHFKQACAYQIEHNPDKRLRAAFQRIIQADTLTCGEAAVVSPFIVNPK